MVVGQDLGVTLDLETYSVRAHGKGIGHATDQVVTGARPGPEGSGAVELDILTHTTGEVAQERYDWVVCALHQTPEDALWHALKDAPFPVHRAGDCLTPRRAHAAVVEGHRAGVAL
ncbi:hypothetical protein ACFPC0_23455 [Streptomyces andamanensis]|uniref:Uncharacterized protein n=2 Tax=Streptomyces TaxID=1883 RepID=A0ABV8TJ09_9ACTN